MPQFRDAQARTWRIEVNVSSVKRVRELTQVDLLDLEDMRVLSRLGKDPILLADVLYALVEPQAKDQGVSDEQFGEGLAGDVIADATDALIEGIVSFCQSPKTREVLGRTIEASRMVADRALEVSAAKLDEILAPGKTDELAEELVAALAEDAERARAISGDRSGSAPESSGSTPDRSPGESS